MKFGFKHIILAALLRVPVVLLHRNKMTKHRSKSTTGS